MYIKVPHVHSLFKMFTQHSSCTLFASLFLLCPVFISFLSVLPMIASVFPSHSFPITDVLPVALFSQFPLVPSSLFPCFPKPSNTLTLGKGVVSHYAVFITPMKTFMSVSGLQCTGLSMYMYMYACFLLISFPGQLGGAKCCNYSV